MAPTTVKQQPATKEFAQPHARDPVYRPHRVDVSLLLQNTKIHKNDGTAQQIGTPYSSGGNIAQTLQSRIYWYLKKIPFPFTWRRSRGFNSWPTVRTNCWCSQTKGNRLKVLFGSVGARPRFGANLNEIWYKHAGPHVVGSLNKKIEAHISFLL